MPDYVSQLVTTSERFYNLSEENAANISYDAYEKDIAMVQVFFKTATVVQVILKFLSLFLSLSLSFSYFLSCDGLFQNCDCISFKIPEYTQPSISDSIYVSFSVSMSVSVCVSFSYFLS